MADANLNTRQLAEILLRLEQIIAAAQNVRQEIHQAMADRRRNRHPSPASMGPRVPTGQTSRRRQ
jgi:hypothetical protein